MPNGYLSGQVAETVWIGVGVNVPFGLETSWDEPWMGRFHATKSKVQAINVNPTIAFQVTDTLSIGAGANWQHLTADFNSGVAYGGLAYAGTAQAVAGLSAGDPGGRARRGHAQLGPAGPVARGPGPHLRQLERLGLERRGPPQARRRRPTSA